mgnify:CR=1 FL=1
MKRHSILYALTAVVVGVACAQSGAGDGGDGGSVILRADRSVGTLLDLRDHPHIKAGRVRPLGYSGAKRLPAIGDVPTIAEAGLPGFAMDTGWHAWFGPAKMPPQVVARIYEAIQKSLQVPSVRKFLLAGGYQPTADPPAVFQKNFPNDIKRWGDLARAAGIDPR